MAMTNAPVLNKLIQVQSNTDFLYSTALDGSETSNSIGDKVADAKTVMDGGYFKVCVAYTTIITRNSVSNDSTVYYTGVDLTPVLPTGCTIKKIILHVVGNLENNNNTSSGQAGVEYRKDSGSWTTIDGTCVADMNSGDGSGVCNHFETVLDVTSAISDYTSTIGFGLGCGGQAGQATTFTTRGSGWFEIYYSMV